MQWVLRVHRDMLSGGEDIKEGFLEEATLDLSLNNEPVLDRRKRRLKFQAQER